MHSLTDTENQAWNEHLPAGLALYAKCVVGAVLLLLFFGALVTSNNAGLSVPDWPTTYGQNMFTFPISRWTGGILFEHGHRLFASFVGLLILVLALAVSIYEKRPQIRALAGFTLLAVLSQGFLGGLTVKLKLPDSISILHGMLGQTVLLLTIALAFLLSSTFKNRERSLAPNAFLFRAAVLGLALLYAQLFLGALTRHTDSGLAIPDFPSMGGSLIPYATDAMLQTANSLRQTMNLSPVSLSQLEIHLAHRIGAVLVSFYLIFIALLSLKQELKNNLAPKLPILLLLTLAIQFCLGALTVLSARNHILASLHVVTGASLLAICFLIALKAFPWKTAQSN